MQEEKEIPKIKNISLITLWSLIFWFVPVSKFKKIGNVNHNQLLKEINLYLFWLLIGMVGYIFLVNLVSLI